LARPSQAQDAAGSADPPRLARYPGSRIDRYEALDFDSFRVSLEALAQSGIPPKTLDVEGKVTRIGYAAPAGRTVPEVYGYYSRLLQKEGFQVLCQCADYRCGDSGGPAPPPGRLQRRLSAKSLGAQGDRYISLRVWDEGSPARTKVEFGLVVGRPTGDHAAGPGSVPGWPKPDRIGGYVWSRNPTRPEQNCAPRGLVCLKTVPLGDMEGFECWLNTSLPGDVTVTIDARLDNLESSAPFPLTEVLRGRSERKVAVLTPSKFGEPWQHYFDMSYRLGSRRAQPDPGLVYTLPFAPGRKVRVKQRFHTGEDEYGLDLVLSTGAPVMAARAGKVLDMIQGGPGPQSEGVGDSILIEHADGSVGQYFGLDSGAAETHVGADVKAGELIGHAGARGRAKEAWLHFGVYVPVDGTRWKSVPVRFETGASSPEVLVEKQEYERR
jgi:hypothetical protein